jgi:mono/diheme cytochrome c family protein
MGKLKTIGMVAGGLAGVVLLAGAGGWVWVETTTSAITSKTYESHSVDFPVPFPLTEEEIAQLRTEKAAQLAAAAPPVDPKAPKTDAAAPPLDPLEGVDLGAIAMERAVERGKHLVEARYACSECHGADFGGGTMVDDPAIGQLMGANLTLGSGSRTLEYKPADWDRIVRHGIRPDGTATPMPAKDFFAMSDRELSDIVAYIRSMPPVDRDMPPVKYGPLGKVLAATGQFVFSADSHPDHQAAHPVEPPPEAPDATFGKHIAQACTGCHRADFSGGPVAGGPPDWPPAANLTPAGLTGWTYEDFKGAMLEGKRPDGTALRPPMADMPKMAKNMSETELQAMWAFLQTLPATPTAQ